MSPTDLPQTLDQIREFLAGDRTTGLRIRTRGHAYAFIEQTLRRFDYFHLGRTDKGLLRRFIATVTGLSRAQITRLLYQHRSTGQLADHRRATRRSFSRRYTTTDIELLAELDSLHGTPSGPAARMLCARACHRFGDQRFERLAGISNSHLYNLRRSAAYRRRREEAQGPAHPVPWASGERWRPGPYERPGHLRVVLAGQRGAPNDLGGLYYLNLVDEVTQYQFADAVEHLDGASLARILDALQQTLPFSLHDFHASAGAGAAARATAARLQALHGGEHSEPQARGDSDSGQAERPDVAIDRPGDGGIVDDRYVEQVHALARSVLAPYLNYHRVCRYPRRRAGPGGRTRGRRRDADLMTPYEKLKSLRGAAACLIPGTTFAQLDAIASAMSDNEAARALMEASDRLLGS